MSIAQCPICQTRFTPPIVPAPPIEKIRIAPQPIDPILVPDALPAENAPFPSERTPVSPDELREMNRVAFCLRWAGSLTMLQVVFCSCIDISDVGAVPLEDSLMVWGVVAILCLRMLAGSILVAVANALERRRHLTLVRCGAVLALILGLYAAGRTVLTIQSYVGAIFPFYIVPSRGMEGPLAVYAACSIILAVFCAVAGIWSLRLLSRPGVQALFAR